MKIDTHQHFWHYQPLEFAWIQEGMSALQRDCMPSDSKQERMAAGVDGVLAVQARTSWEETDFLLSLAERHSDILGVVGWADLAAPDLSMHIDRWREHRAMRGIRHILQDEPDVNAWLANPRHAHGLKAVQREAWVYEVLVFGHQLSSVSAFCAAHDAHWLVLDHLGKPPIRDWQANPEVARHWGANLRNLATLPHIMCKLSGLVTETDWVHSASLNPTDGKIIATCFDMALEAFGPQRLMYGSDWPVCQLAANYDTVHGLAHKWAKSRLTVSEQEAFWAGNAVRCYGLSVPTLV